jgi:hypothetical protein
MMDEETAAKVREAIQQARNQGKTDEEIGQFMAKAGYSEDEISQIFGAPGSQAASPGSLEEAFSTGQAAPQAILPAPAPGIQCPNCGTLNNTSARFCAKCGSNFSAPQAQQAPPTAAPMASATPYVPPAPSPPQQTPAQLAPRSMPAPSFQASAPALTYTPPKQPQYTGSGGKSTKKKLIILSLAILFIIILIMVILPWMGTSAIISQCEAEVGERSSPEAKREAIASCLQNKAEEIRDASICMAIDEELKMSIIPLSRRKNCVARVGRQTEDFMVCNLLAGQDRNDCLEFVGCHMKDKSVCHMLSGPGRGYCGGGVVSCGSTPRY